MSTLHTTTLASKRKRAGIAGISIGDHHSIAIVSKRGRLSDDDDDEDNNATKSPTSLIERSAVEIMEIDNDDDDDDDDNEDENGEVTKDRDPPSLNTLILELQRILHAMEVNPSGSQWRDLLMRADRVQSIWNQLSKHRDDSSSSLEMDGTLLQKTLQALECRVQEAVQKALELARTMRQSQDATTEDVVESLVSSLAPVVRSHRAPRPVQFSDGMAEISSGGSDHDEEVAFKNNNNNKNNTNNVNTTNKNNSTNTTSSNRNHSGSKISPTSTVTPAVVPTVTPAKSAPSAAVVVEDLQAAQREQMEQAIAHLASQMKAKTASLHQTIQKQNTVLLNEMESTAEDNAAAMTDLVKQTNDHVRKSWTRSATTWVAIIAIAIAFVFTIVIIVMVPKQPNACLFFCPPKYSNPSPERGAPANVYSMQKDRTKQQHQQQQQKQQNTLTDSKKDHPTFYEDDLEDIKPPRSFTETKVESLDRIKAATPAVEIVHETNHMFVEIEPSASKHENHHAGKYAEHQSENKINRNSDSDTVLLSDFDSVSNESLDTQNHQNDIVKEYDEDANYHDLSNVVDDQEVQHPPTENYNHDTILDHDNENNNYLRERNYNDEYIQDQHHAGAFSNHDTEEYIHDTDHNLYDDDVHYNEHDSHHEDGNNHIYSHSYSVEQNNDEFEQQHVIHSEEQYDDEYGTETDEYGTETNEYDTETNDMDLPFQVSLAASQGDVETLALILSQRKEWLNAQDSNGWAAIHEAANNGRSETVAFLINAGCDVSLLTLSGHTALDLASHRFPYEHPTVQLLLQASLYHGDLNDEDVHCDVDSNGQCIQHPISNDRTTASDENDASTPTRESVLADFEATKNYHYSNSISDVNVGNMNNIQDIGGERTVDQASVGFIPLYKGTPITVNDVRRASVIRGGNGPEASSLLDGFLRVLLDANIVGDYVNEPDQNGWTTLHLAVNAGIYENIKLLLDSGADINALTLHTRNTALDIAYHKYGGDHPITQLLEDYEDEDIESSGDY